MEKDEKKSFSLPQLPASTYMYNILSLIAKTVCHAFYKTLPQFILVPYDVDKITW